MLLANVADANGCTAVWSKSSGFTTVFGFVDELDAVDELFTSLLVQATAALRRAGSKSDGYGRSRTTRFRRSFLVAFAVRIGQRLRETVDATVESAVAETGTAPRPDPRRAAGAAIGCGGSRVPRHPPLPTLRQRRRGLAGGHPLRRPGRPLHRSRAHPPDRVAVVRNCSLGAAGRG